MDTDQSEEELKQVVLHVSEIEKVEVKQGHTSKEVVSEKLVTQEVVQEVIQADTHVESTKEVSKQSANATPAKSTGKTKMVKWKIVPYVFN